MRAPRQPSLSCKLPVMVKEDHIDLYGEVPDSIVDGPGLRYGVFVQGCTHGCPGCHNPESQPVEGGTPTAIADIVARIRSNGLISGVTLSGGEPFEQSAACAELARQLKEAGYSVWAYSGYLYEDLLARAQHDEGTARLLDLIDVLVDGPFVESLKSYTLTWCGSSNQRVIDMARTRASGSLVLWQNETYDLKKPESW